MLARNHKLTSPAQFRRVIKEGSRAATGTVVVHFFDSPDLVSSGPRVGLVVSKAVGNAVARHRLSRQLRHCVSAHFAELAPTTDIVIRALAPAAGASSSQLAADIHRGIAKARKKWSTATT